MSSLPTPRIDRRRIRTRAALIAAGQTLFAQRSVDGVSIDEIMAEPAIDGALVGGASLKPDEMAGIVARAGLTARARASAAAQTRSPIRWNPNIE